MWNSKQMEQLPDSRIVFLAGTLGAGGAERQLFYILSSLKCMGCDVILISLNQGEYWEKPIRDLNIPIYWVGKSENRFLRLFSLISLVNSLRPILIQSQHFYTNLYSAIAGRLLRVTDIGAIRSNGVNEVKKTGTIFGWLSLYIPKYLAANSLAGKNFAETSGVPAHCLRLLPNVVDTNLFTPRHTERTNKFVTLLFVSNLYLREKRAELFIQAIAKLGKLIKTPISALIVGDGPLKADMELIAKEQGVYSSQLQFLGNTDHVEDIYKQADILVLTSDREGTPNVIMEAMASGLPVVATSVGGVPDLVQDGSTGFLVEAGDLNGLVEKLAILIEDPKLRNQLGTFGREYIISHYSLEQLPNILRDFYSTIH